MWRSRVKSWTRSPAIVLLAVAFFATVLFHLRLDPIERLRRHAQLADMREQFNSVPVPSGFRLIAISEAPYPVVFYYFAAPSLEQPVCDRVLEAARSSGDPKPWSGHPCGYSMRIAAGWRAWLAAVWTYELRAFTSEHERPMLSPSDEICVRELKDKPPLESRLGPCWLGEGESYVYFGLYGAATYVEGDESEGEASEDAV